MQLMYSLLSSLLRSWNECITSIPKRGLCSTSKEALRYKPLVSPVEPGTHIPDDLNSVMHRAPPSPCFPQILYKGKLPFHYCATEWTSSRPKLDAQLNPQLNHC